MQTSSVWDSFQGKICRAGEALPLEKVDLYHEISHSLEGWAQDFCVRIKQESPVEKPFLLGYSLGGRLAMHAYINEPDLWSGLIIVSADPGGHNAQQKEHLLQQDLLWSERFRKERVETLLLEWDQASVFSQRPNQAPRNIDQLDAEKISKLISVYSKGRQEDLIAKLRYKRQAPILFLSGIEDQKYSVIGQNFERCCPHMYHQNIADAGHRVPWENPAGFLSAVNQFIGSTLAC